MDREKVIKALECRKNADKRCGNPCEDTGLCHYATAVRGLDGEIYRPFVCDRKRICADAIALLKEQEKAKVVFGRCKDGSFATECGYCGMYLDKAYSTCPKCNKELDWNSNQD